MRKGSVAIVPLLLGVFTLFWFIWFMGASSDTLHRVNNVENLQHLQERLLLSAARYRFEYERANPGLSSDEYDAITDTYIDNMMVSNKIQDVNIDTNNDSSDTDDTENDDENMLN